jgi:hypothetical protein
MTSKNGNLPYAYPIGSLALGGVTHDWLPASAEECQVTYLSAYNESRCVRSYLAIVCNEKGWIDTPFQFYNSSCILNMTKLSSSPVQCINFKPPLFPYSLTRQNIHGRSFHETKPQNKVHGNDSQENCRINMTYSWSLLVCALLQKIG